MGYQRVPSCAYQIAEFTVTRDGNLEFPDNTDPEIVNGLIDSLEEVGFRFPGDEADAVSVDTDENASVAGKIDKDKSISMTGGECTEDKTAEISAV